MTGFDPQDAPPSMPASMGPSTSLPLAKMPAGSADVQLPGGVAVANPWLRLGACVLEGLLATVTLWIGWLIWAALISGTGQTPAKRLLNLRVIRADTLRPAGFARMLFIRGWLAGIVASFAIFFTLGILLFMPLWDRRHQNIWDKVSNTYVV